MGVLSPISSVGAHFLLLIMVVVDELDCIRIQFMSANEFEPVGVFEPFVVHLIKTPVLHDVF